jgi:hypothetical protein
MPALPQRDYARIAGPPGINVHRGPDCPRRTQASAARDYGFIALDVTPAARGRRTTMTLRFINEQGRELDRVVFSRTAGDVLRRL